MTEPQENTRETPGALDAFESLKPDEPHWTLQGGDPLAPPTIFFWCLLARWKAGFGSSALRLPEVIAQALSSAKPAETEAEQQELLIRASNSEEVAWQMQAYFKGQSAESDADAAYEQSLEHSQMIDSGNEDALQKLLAHRKLNRAIAQLGDAAARIDDVRKTLEELGGYDEPFPYLSDLTKAQSVVNSTADAITPRRAGAPT